MSTLHGYVCQCSVTSKLQAGLTDEEDGGLGVTNCNVHESGET